MTAPHRKWSVKVETPDGEKIDAHIRVSHDHVVISSTKWWFRLTLDDADVMGASVQAAADAGHEQEAANAASKQESGGE